MSLRATLWALYEAPAKDPTARLVLVVLADHAGDDGRDAFPSVARIASAIEVSDRSVQRHLRDLEEAGLIVKGDQDRVKAAIKRGDRQPVCYDLQLGVVRGDNMTPRDPDGVTPASPRDDNGVTSTSPRDPDGVTPVTERGDTGVANGVTPASPEPKDEPKEEPEERPADKPPDDSTSSGEATPMPSLSDEEIHKITRLPGDPKHDPIAKRWCELKAHNGAMRWVAHCTDDLKIKVPEAGRAVFALRRQILVCLEVGYTPTQIWQALSVIGKPRVSSGELESNLRILDRKVGNVNTGWDDPHEPPSDIGESR